MGRIEELKEELAEAQAKLAVLMANAPLQAEIAAAKATHEAAQKADSDARDAYHAKRREVGERLRVLVEGDDGYNSFHPEFVAALEAEVGLPRESANGLGRRSHDRPFDLALRSTSDHIIAADPEVKTAGEACGRANAAGVKARSAFSAVDQLVRIAERAIREILQNLNEREGERDDRRERAAGKKADVADEGGKRREDAKKKLAEIAAGKRAFAWPPKEVV